MKGLQTKQAWLERMTALRACESAMDWVRSLPADITGEEIWNSIPAKHPHSDWLRWFAMRNQNKEVYELFVKAVAMGEVVEDFAASAAQDVALKASKAARAADAANDDAFAAAIRASYAVDVDGDDEVRAAVPAAAYCAKFRELFPFSKMDWI